MNLRFLTEVRALPTPTPTTTTPTPTPPQPPLFPPPIFNLEKSHNHPHTHATRTLNTQHAHARAHANAHAHAHANADAECVDIPGFTGPFGQCSTYAPSGINSGRCIDDGVAEACAKSCNLCNGTPPPTSMPTFAPSPGGSANNWPKYCADWDGFDNGFGGCSSYSKAECASNLLCNFNFCEQDGADFYCPHACLSCNSYPDWMSDYGNCDSYSETYCTTANPECNHKFCATDVTPFFHPASHLCVSTHVRTQRTCPR